MDVAQAANARDELRAHYLARSAMELSRMLIKIQLKFVEPVMATAQSMLTDMADGQDLGISLRVTDYTGPLLGFLRRPARPTWPCWAAWSVSTPPRPRA